MPDITKVQPWLSSFSRQDLPGRGMDHDATEGLFSGLPGGPALPPLPTGPGLAQAPPARWEGAMATASPH